MMIDGGLTCPKRACLGCLHVTLLFPVLFSSKQSKATFRLHPKSCSAKKDSELLLFVAFLSASSPFLFPATLFAVYSRPDGYCAGSGEASLPRYCHDSGPGGRVRERGSRTAAGGENQLRIRPFVSRLFLLTAVR